MRKSVDFARDAALAGIMTALLTSGKLALSFIPNIEVVSFMIIMFSVCFGKKTLFSVLAFVIVEGLLYGFGIWWASYLYVWPILCITACLVRKKASRFTLTVISTMFGLLFGFLCSFVYIFAGTANPGIGYAVSWWIAGIPFDLIHAAGNFAVMVCLYKPVLKALSMAAKKS